MKQVMKPVFKYDSYPEYLQDYVEFMKLHKKNWSISSWAKKLELSTTSSLTNIIQGRRPPSHKMAVKIIGTIAEVSELEKVYFLLLVELFKNSENVSLTESIKKRMGSIKPRNTFKQINEDQLSKIANWYSYGIREMVNLKDFKKDNKWIAQRLSPRITENEVEMAISSLIEIGLLSINDGDKLVLASDSFETSTDLKSSFLKKYHKSTLTLAAEKIDSCPVDKRHFNSTTISLRKEDLQAAKMFIENTRREFLETFDRSGGDEIYNLSLAFFPLTESE
ncbi:MAG: TIGR02147 family protein [Bacteriovoracaceae bacterium]